jgi:Uma2 family endonuclease
MSTHRRSRRKLTLEQYECLPEDDGYRDELSRGWLVREAQPAYPHGAVAGNLHVLLRRFVDEHDLGIVTIETGYELPDLPATVRGPDVAYVAAARLPPEAPEKWLQLAPDLAIEVLSPSNRRKYIEGKIADYFDSGTTEIWFVRPRQRTITVHRRGAEPYVLSDDAVLTTELLPGLRLPLSEVFRMPHYSNRCNGTFS